MYSGHLQALVKRTQPSINIIEEFAGLSAQRKMLLCDHLFTESYATYQATVKLLWPGATSKDTKKLEKFLILLRKTAH